MEYDVKRLQRWIQECVLPEANAWEEQQSLPPKVLESMAELGCFSLTVPEEYGGSSVDAQILGQSAAAVAAGSVSMLSVLVVHCMAAQALARFGDAAQKQALLPAMAAGKIRAAFALTEPDFGSEATGIVCRARRCEQGFIINGAKRWISGSGYANFFLLFVNLENEGITALLTPADSPGLSITPMRGLLGFRAAGICELNFKDCLVPYTLPYKGAPQSLLGPAGGGFSFVGSHALHTGRYLVGWGGVGLIQACLEAGMDYASKRVQFAVPLRKHQLIQGMIADMATDLEAVRALGTRAATSYGEAGADALMDIAIFKYFSSTRAFAAATAALQLHGGNGCSPDYPVQRYFRDAKICEIIEGSSQMQQLMISNAAFMRHRRQKRKKHVADN